MYRIESSTNNMSLQIGIIYGKIELLIANASWKDQLEELTKYRASISAITTDKNIFEKLPADSVPAKKLIIAVLGAQKYAEYTHYRKVLERITPRTLAPLSIDVLKHIHHEILPEDEFTFRENAKLLPKLVTVNNIVKEVELQVRTTPEEIVGKLTKFLTWFNSNYSGENPIILAALAHYYIVEIHPFSDGNGRLSNILGNVGFVAGGLFSKKIFAIEHYLLQNIEIYYEHIEEATLTGDLTKWISFYTEALLASLIDTSKLIKKITFGAVDIEHNRQVKLNELETKVLQILSQRPSTKITQIATELDCSRQYIHTIINRLKVDGMVQVL